MDPTESDKTYTQVIPNSELIALNEDDRRNSMQFAMRPWSRVKLWNRRTF